MVGELNFLATKSLIKELKEASVLILEEDEIFQVVAQTIKKSHSALVGVGFTEEQATMIIAHQGSIVKLR